MKAAVVENAGQLVVRELPDPPMGKYEARCEMLYGSVCAGTDTHLLHFHVPFCYWMQMPFILGHESVGRVVDTGEKVRHLKPGDLITRVGSPAVGGIHSGWGGFATTGIASDWRAMQEDGIEGWTDKTVQQILPPDVDPAVGTLFITWRETLSYVMRMGIGQGKSVLVMGSGGNGLAFVSHARNLGASRIVMVGAARRMADGTRAGATETYDYRSAECWAALENGFDFVIDSVGTALNVAAGQKALKPGGTIGIYGLDEAGKVTLSPDKTFTFYNGHYDEAEAHEAVLRFYRNGELKADVWQVRDQEFSLTDIREALAAVEDRTLVKPLVRLSQ